MMQAFGIRSPRPFLLFKSEGAEGTLHLFGELAGSLPDIDKAVNSSASAAPLCSRIASQPHHEVSASHMQTRVATPF